MAHAIAQTTNRTTSLSETVHETILEKATKETGMLEHGEITSSVPLTSVHTVAAQSIQQSTAQTNLGTNMARGRQRTEIFLKEHI